MNKRRTGGRPGRPFHIGRGSKGAPARTGGIGRNPVRACDHARAIELRRRSNTGAAGRWRSESKSPSPIPHATVGGAGTPLPCDVGDKIGLVIFDYPANLDEIWSAAPWWPGPPSRQRRRGHVQEGGGFSLIAQTPGAQALGFKFRLLFQRWHIWPSLPRNGFPGGRGGTAGIRVARGTCGNCCWGNRRNLSSSPRSAVVPGARRSSLVGST